MPNNSPEHMRYMNLRRWPHQPIEQRFWRKVSVKSANECWPWTGSVNGDGYGMFWAERRSIASHRMVLALVGGTIPTDKLVLHKCDNPPCCNPNHLYFGTDADNNRDMIERGRHRYPVGERVNTAKLKAQQVLEIRQRLNDGEQPPALAALFNVSTATIRAIKHRRSWKHI